MIKNFKIRNLFLTVLIAFILLSIPYALLASEAKETGASVIFILMEKKQATVSDLLDVLMVFNNKPLEGLSTEDKVSALRTMGVIPQRTKVYPDAILRKGFASLLFYRTLNISGGLLLRIAGTSTRNCLRELDYLNIMPQSSERDKMTGPELMALLYKAKEYVAENKEKK